MINGDANYFLECVYDLHELIHIYHDKKYFIQGYGGWNEKPYTLEVQLWEPEEKMLWNYSSENIQDCYEAYLNAPLYDGKVFWDAEQEIEWVDE